MKNFFAEFKKFISRGNVLDMAVGVIIGGAFSAIIGSLVNDIVMPVLSLVTGGLDFTSLKIMLGTAEDAASINYGTFIQAVVNFLLMALVVFTLVKTVNKLTEKKEAPKPEEPKEPTTKVCPYCQSEISIKATRCPHCTSALED